MEKGKLTSEEVERYKSYKSYKPTTISNSFPLRITTNLHF